MHRQRLSFDEFKLIASENEDDCKDALTKFIEFAEGYTRCWVRQFAESDATINFWTGHDKFYMGLGENIDVYDDEVTEFQCRKCESSFDRLDDLLRHFWENHLMEML